MKTTNKELYKTWKPSDISYFTELSEKYTFIIHVENPKEYNNLKVGLQVLPFEDSLDLSEKGIPIQYDILSDHEDDDNISFLIENIFADMLRIGMENQEQEEKRK